MSPPSARSAWRRFDRGGRATRSREVFAILGYALLGASSAGFGQLTAGCWQPAPPPALVVLPAAAPPAKAPEAEPLAPTETPPRELSLEAMAEGPRPAAPEALEVAPVVVATPRGFESAELQALRLAEQAEGGRVVGPPAGWPAALLREGSMPARTGAWQAPEGWGELRRPGLAVPPHPRVVAHLQYFSRDARGRRVFRHWLRKSGLYRDGVTQALAKRNLPAELLAVVFVESGGQPTAVSSAGATGLWQLMPATARAYGLSINPYVDERRGLGRSTEAAVAHLSDLYDRFLSWDMALAAYNLGYQGLVDRADALGRDDYWALADQRGALPEETAAYVPRVLALAIILSNLDHFGFDDVDVASPVDVSELDVPPGTPLTTVARAAGTSLAGLRALNPELLRTTLPPEGDALSLHVPSAGWARARLMLPRLIADRDGIEDGVSDSFDWGRDEVPALRTRLTLSSPR